MRNGMERNKPHRKVNYDKIPEPLRINGAGATEPAHRDILRDLENPNMLVPPLVIFPDRC
jgi:oxalate decarboxylase